MEYIFERHYALVEVAPGGKRGDIAPQRNMLVLMFEGENQFLGELAFYSSPRWETCSRIRLVSLTSIIFMQRIGDYCKQG